MALDATGDDGGDVAPAQHPVSARSRAATREIADVEAFLTASGVLGAADPDISDFTFGNPHEMPLRGLVDALTRSAEPRAVDWYAYKASEEGPRTFLAESLLRELQLPFDPQDVALTAGAIGAIGLAFHLLTDPGDEVVIPVPGWFLYAPMLRQAGAIPVEAALHPTAGISTSRPSTRRSPHGRGSSS